MSYRGLVLGFYHQRNAGDDRLGACIAAWLHGHELTFMSHMQRPARAVLHQMDYVLLGGGSIATAAYGAFDGIEQWGRRARLPVFAAGITCSAYPEVRAAIAGIPSTGGSVWVRDAQSAAFLRESVQVTLAPDLSWLHPLCFPGLQPTAGVALNLRPPIKAGPDAERWRAAVAACGLDLRPWSLCFGKEPDAPELQRVAGLVDPLAWFDPTVPARSRAVIAMRYHAVLFAIQSGTPVLPLVNAGKLTRFCEAESIRQWSLEAPPPSLAAAVEAAEKAQPAERLEEITGRLNEEAWRAAADFRDRIETAVDASRCSRRALGYRVGLRLRRMLGDR